MFRSPSKRVLTRRQREIIDNRLDCASLQLTSSRPDATVPSRGTRSNILPRPQDIEQVKMEKTPQKSPSAPGRGGNSVRSAATSGRTKLSTASSLARRKQLELEAAEARAKIQLELIDKRLERDLALAEAEVGDEGISECSEQRQNNLGHKNIEKWLDNSVLRANDAHEQPAEQAVAAESPAGASARALCQQDIPVNSIEQLAYTLRDMMDYSSSQREERLLSRLATPRELPIFSGDCIEWLHFKCAYEESTHICKYSDSENLWRLRRSLRGEAREAVTDLLIGNTPPAAVMEALEIRFGRSDIIISNITAQLKRLPALPTNYQQELINFSVKINNCVATMRALKQCDHLRSPELATAIISKLPSTLMGKWTDYAYKKILDGNSKIELMADFLKEESKMLSVVGLITPYEQKKISQATEKREVEKKFIKRPVLVTTQVKEQCAYCRKSEHALPDCRMFRRAMRRDKWRFVKNSGLCYCCLSARHDKELCTAPVCDVDECGMRHHRLLHWITKPTPPSPDASQSSPASLTQSTVAHVASESYSNRMAEVILKVVMVQLRGPTGTVSAHALLDDAATVSMIDSELADSLGLVSVQSSAIKFIDAFGIEVLQSDAPKVSAFISTNDCGDFYDINLRKVSKLNLPVQDLSIVNNINCKHLLHVKECVCKERVRPLLLIGEDNYHLIAPIEIIPGSKNEPYATRCQLGWTIHGYCGRTHTRNDKHIFSLSHSNNVNESLGIEQLNEIIKDSFTLESIGISTLRRENTAHVSAIQSLDETSRHLGDRWEVGLPFKRDKFIMPDSYPIANSRLQNLLRRFSSDVAYAERYRREIDKLFENGYARVLSDNELYADHIWYMPHFGVQNINKPGKLRLVFDAASRVEGVCLNDYLHTGPDLYNSLLGIMLRFRENEVVIIGDIREMFLQIKIRTEDQNVLRFLWQESRDSPVKTCVMQRLVFGATCSPFIAQYIRNKNALKYDDLYPEAVSVIINDHYMDDCLHSTSSVDNAIKLVKDITTIHKSGGFDIRGWSSNSKEVLATVPADALAHSAVQFAHGAMNTTERTLGLMWYPAEDCFRFAINYERVPPDILNGVEPPTKARMLSIIMSIYDIHGFLSPFIIKSKIIFQNVHRSGIDWKCHIQPQEFNSWIKWLDELKHIKSLRIPRWYSNASVWSKCYPYSECSWCIEKIQLHTFSDASIKAYAAVIYLRFIRSDGQVNVCFVSGKSRVSPLRPVSIPRLELQGALLAARLASTVQKEHRNLKIDQRIFWTDSSTVLSWLRSDPRSYKPYVAHRLGEIDELTTVAEWRYVPSGLNVADIATKEDSPPLKYSDPWYQGPNFLRQPESSWPKDLKQNNLPASATVEKRSVMVVAEKETEPFLINENNFSSWLRLLRSTAMVLLFIKRCRRDRCAQLDVDIMAQAELILIKKCQHDCFFKDIDYLKRKNTTMPNSRLSTLTPYLDDFGVLRVGGRVDKITGASLEATRPAILDGKHRIARLLVECYHKRALHGANELVVNELRQHYWIIKLRPTVRGVARNCLFCRYRRAAPRAQRMADLPSARLQHNRRPFTFTGVDFFGPMEVTIGRRRAKRYGVLFTCLTVRAIHIELTDSLSADATIMALRRMIGRRGTPSVIYSDNGTNFRGADNELKRSLEELNRDKVKNESLVKGIQWHFIPPGAPEMGGAWERMIRTVKVALKVILRERAPHPETLSTLLIEVEALVNSRPITYVSTDPNYPEALTPNHFLLGTSSNGPSVGKYDNSDICLRKQWRVAQRLTDMFWKRWMKEYLPTLLPRQKWTNEERSLQVGDYVILVEPNLERGSWRHGIVSATHAGHDDRVRVVDVRTRTGLLRRPVTRVALLSPTECSAD